MGYSRVGGFGVPNDTGGGDIVDSTDNIVTIEDTLDLNGNRLTLDADADSYIESTVDDQVSFFSSGAEVYRYTASDFTFVESLTDVNMATGRFITGLGRLDSTRTLTVIPATTSEVPFQIQARASQATSWFNVSQASGDTVLDCLLDGSCLLDTGIRVARTTVSDTAYTVDAGADGPRDNIVAFITLTATRAVTLPTATEGRELVIKDEAGAAGANNITIVGTVDTTVNPTAISANFGVYRIYSDGTNWFTR